MPLPLSDSTAVIVTHLAKHLKENKSVDTFFDDFTAATVDWLRPLFLIEDDRPSSAVQKLLENPDSNIKRELVKAALLAEIEDAPALRDKSIALAEDIQRKTGDNSQKENSQKLGDSSTGNILMQDFKAGGAISVNVNKKSEDDS